MANPDVKRREFLKQGIGLAGVSLIPFELDSRTVENKTSSNPPLENILKKYGTEFGQIKPEFGRKNHGHI